MIERASSRSPAVSAMIGRALHVYWRFSRGLTLGVRGVVLDGAERVFLIRHTYVPGWHLPGGGVEAGETALEALSRELAEEGRIALRGVPPLHGVFFNERVSNRDHVLVYVIREFEVAGPKLPDREIAEAGFHPLDALPEGTTAPTRRRLDEIVSRAPVVATW
jgi:ADP-ribose pyrophosphatase YjhB (NUDIX family)